MNNIFTMETTFSEIEKLKKENEDFSTLIDYALPQVSDPFYSNKKLGDLGERNTYNAVTSFNFLGDDIVCGRKFLFLQENYMICVSKRHEGNPWCFIFPSSYAGKTDILHSSGLPIASELTKAGMNTIVMEYRLAGRTSANAFVKESVQALKKVREAFGIDLNQYLCYGFSYGGCMAAVLSSSEYGVSRYGFETPRGVACAFTPFSMIEKEIEQKKLYSQNYPPIYLIHGEMDEIIPIREAERVVAYLKEQKIPFFFRRVKDGKHNFGKGYNTQADGWLQDSLDFFIHQNEL